MRTHRDADLRSLALHTEVERALARDPSLRDAARARLARLPAPYAEAWRALLDGPLDVLLAALVSESEEHTALRQASPFSFVLDKETRWRVLRATVRTGP